MKEKILKYLDKEKILKYLDKEGYSRVRDKQTYEEFVQTIIKEDICLSDIYDLYEEYYNLVKFLWDLAHEE